MQLAAHDVELLMCRVDDLEDSLAAALAKIEAHRLRENSLKAERAELRLALVRAASASASAGGRGGGAGGEGKQEENEPRPADEEDAAAAAATVATAAAAAAPAPAPNNDSSSTQPPAAPPPPPPPAPPPPPPARPTSADIVLLPGLAPGSVVVGPESIDFYELRARVPRHAFLGIVPVPREAPPPQLPPPRPRQSGGPALLAACLNPAPSTDAFPPPADAECVHGGNGGGGGGDGARRRQGDGGCPPHEDAPLPPAVRRDVGGWAARLAGLVGAAGAGGSNNSLSSLGGGAGAGAAGRPARADADADDATAATAAAASAAAAAARATALTAAAAAPGAHEGATAVWHPMPLPSFSRQDSRVVIRQQQQLQQQQQQQQQRSSSGGGVGGVGGVNGSGGSGGGGGVMVPPMPVQVPMSGAGAAPKAATFPPTTIPGAAPAVAAPSFAGAGALETAPSLRLAPAWQVLWRSADPSALPHCLAFEAAPEARELLQARTEGWGDEEAVRGGAPAAEAPPFGEGQGAAGSAQQGRSDDDGYRDADADGQGYAAAADDGGFELAMPRHLAPPALAAEAAAAATNGGGGGGGGGPAASFSSPAPPRLSEPSSVVNPDVVSHPDLWLRGLAAALPARFARREAWTLAYSTRRDGTALSTLLRRSRGLAPTVLLVRDGGGGCFGAFCPEAWRLSPRFFGSGEAFVFQLAPHSVAYPWRVRGARGGRRNDYFQYATEAGIAVGGGGGAFAIWLDEELRRGSSGNCATFGSPCLATAGEFDVHAVELWHVGGHGAGGAGAAGGHQYGGV